MEFTAHPGKNILHNKMEKYYEEIDRAMKKLPYMHVYPPVAYSRLYESRYSFQQFLKNGRRNSCTF